MQQVTINEVTEPRLALDFSVRYKGRLVRCKELVLDFDLDKREFIYLEDEKIEQGK